MAERPWQKFYDYYVPQTIRYPQFPAQRIFQLTAGVQPNKVCTSFYGTELTFWQVREQVLRLANALAAQGVKKATAWAFICPTARSLSLPTWPSCIWAQSL